MNFPKRVVAALAAVLLLPALFGAGGLQAARAQTIDRPAWHFLPLTNARTGEVFTLADFGGRAVYVEPMATWCSKCREQLDILRDVRAQPGGDQPVFIALSVETDVSNDDLARYADAAGFDWLFAVATPELLRELSATFGRTITNPPATPHFVLRPDGTTDGLTTGIHSAESILREVSAAGGG